MSRLMMILFSVACLSFGVCASADLPSKATYLFYIQGGYAGKCDIHFGEDGDRIVFESVTTLTWDDYKLELNTRTEVEKETLRPVFYEYSGTKMDQKVSGTISVEGDSMSASNALGDIHFPSGTRMSGPTYFFENYVSDHQIVMAWAIDRADNPFFRFTTLLPSEFMPLAAVATLDSEIELPTNPAPVVCKKFAIMIKNSTPYYIYYDPKSKMPLYMDFPSALTEVFLESVYGEKPETKYERPKESE